MCPTYPYQASRRHYRLNQTMECRTFYLAYQGTLQEGVVKIMAEKKVATAAIQGKFSSEGLAAMAQSVDAQVELAKMLMDRDSAKTENISEMYRQINTVQNCMVGVKVHNAVTTQRWQEKSTTPMNLIHMMEQSVAQVMEQIEFNTVIKASRKNLEGQLTFI